MALNVQLLRDSFSAIARKENELVDNFYQLLFLRYPAVRPLFSNVRLDDQKEKFIRSISLIIQNIEKPDYLKAYLGGLGQMHVAYGVEESHYPAVGECLLAALESVAGRAWNDELKAAWAEAYGVVAEMMITGARAANAEVP